MSMFDKYDNIDPDYIPDNSSPDKSMNICVVEDTLPRPLFDIKNRFTGYSWNYGEVFDWELSVSEKIKVYSDSIVYYKTGEQPEVSTEGKSGQQAYNVVDCKSWTCAGKYENEYVWIIDDVVVYPEDGNKELELCPDMHNKVVQFDIFNFRWEHLVSFSSQGSTKVEISVDKELNEKLKPGVYYSTLKISGEESVILKEKYMIVVR